jgi:hypothetical protein
VNNTNKQPLNLMIRSTVFSPAVEGDPYLVVASAFSGHPADARKSARRNCFAATLEEAAAKCCELARSIQSIAWQCGDNVAHVHCSHCPTPKAPECGALAQAMRTAAP